MSFFSGRLSFIKFRVRGRKPSMFGPDHLEKLAANASGKARIMAADATDVGWNAGDHILDTDFSLEKNIVNDSLQFALRIDRVKLRYRSRPVPCRVAGDPDKGHHARLELELSEPVEGAAPGQLACLLDGELVVGWATIARSRRLAATAP